MDHHIKSLCSFFIVALLLCIHSSNAFRSLPIPIPIPTGGSSHHFRRLSPQEHHSRFQRRLDAEVESGGKSGRVFSVVDFGADPTGKADSHEAFQAVMHAAFNVPGNGKQLLKGVKDLGGVVINLAGGEYAISKPIVLPSSGGGNLVIRSGTIRADNSFPGDRYLIEQNSAQFEDITYRDLLLDSNMRGGGLTVHNSVRTRIDNLFVTHFTTHGIHVTGGHETVITSSFLGQHITTGGDPEEGHFSGTAIHIESNDNIVTDVAIFSAEIGIDLVGGANILTGVHCYNKATGWGGVGIRVRHSPAQNRIDNCYMDWTGIVLEDPVQVHVTNGFFLGNANIVLEAKQGTVLGLTIVDNMFAGQGWKTPIISVRGEFHHVEQVVIERNNVREMNLKATVVKMTQSGNGNKWVVDFNPLLVFPNIIHHVDYAFMEKGNEKKFTSHAVTSVANNVVVIESKEVVDAAVSVTVDQYWRPGENLSFH